LACSEEVAAWGRPRRLVIAWLAGWKGPAFYDGRHHDVVQFFLRSIHVMSRLIGVTCVGYRWPPGATLVAGRLCMVAAVQEFSLGCVQDLIPGSYQLTPSQWAAQGV
jgi:hypothetical protein